MKTLFIPAKSKIKLDKTKFLAEAKKLPKNIVVAYSIQYKVLAESVKEVLSKTHTINSIIQILGCSNPNLPKYTKAVLLIGQARFHAISLAFESNLPIYIMENNIITKVTESEVAKLKQNKNKAKLKFLNSDSVGVLISIKPGQNRLNRALKLKDKYKNKKFYFFLSNNINSNEFENFGISCYINTACPRLDLDSSVINLSEVENLS